MNSLRRCPLKLLTSTLFFSRNCRVNELRIGALRQNGFDAAWFWVKPITPPATFIIFFFCSSAWLVPIPKNEILVLMVLKFSSRYCQLSYSEADRPQKNFKKSISEARWRFKSFYLEAQINNISISNTFIKL